MTIIDTPALQSYQLGNTMDDQIVQQEALSNVSHFPFFLDLIFSFFFLRLYTAFLFWLRRLKNLKWCRCIKLRKKLILVDRERLLLPVDSIINFNFYAPVLSWIISHQNRFGQPSILQVLVDILGQNPYSPVSIADYRYKLGLEIFKLSNIFNMTKGKTRFYSHSLNPFFTAILNLAWEFPFCVVFFLNERKSIFSLKSKCKKESYKYYYKNPLKKRSP